MSQTPRWDELLSRLVAVLPQTRRGNPEPAELAAFLRKDRGQVYQWIVEKRILPNGEVVLAILDFVRGKESAAVNPKVEEGAK